MGSRLLLPSWALALALSPSELSVQLPPSPGAVGVSVCLAQPKHQQEILGRVGAFCRAFLAPWDVLDLGSALPGRKSGLVNILKKKPLPPQKSPNPPISFKKPDTPCL